MDHYTLQRGDAPLLISLPHDGTAIPEEIAARMTEAARRVPDTDWHVGRLYAFAADLGATVLDAHWSRYVVDLNRPPDGHALYPGRTETGLVPLATFSGQRIYAKADEPEPEEIRRRVERYWMPYHRALEQEIQRLRGRHPRVLVWEGHSIRSEVPMFFQGRLPDFNLGTADGASCSSELQQCLGVELESQSRYSHVVNGRFKGGYNTRRYGRPRQGVETVQLELAQLNYMDEDSFEYLPERAESTQKLIWRLLEKGLLEIGRT